MIKDGLLQSWRTPAAWCCSAGRDRDGVVGRVDRVVAVPVGSLWLGAGELAGALQRDVALP